MVEIIKRGEIWVANLKPNRGDEIGKARPVVILQEDRITATGLRTVLVAPLTTQLRPVFAPLRIPVNARSRLLRDCYAMVEHVTAMFRRGAADDAHSRRNDSRGKEPQGCFWFTGVILFFGK